MKIRISKNFRLLFLLIACFNSTKAQLINGPIVSGRFEQNFLTENFDKPTPAWPIVSTGDNLLLIQEGELVIQRRVNTSPFAVIATIENALSEYRLVTSMKLIKTGDDGSMGLIFMAQPAGAGGFLFEINTKQQYRIRQITGTVYRFMSGDARNNGWIKNQLINVNGIANVIEVRTMNRKYDLFINNRYLLSFSEMAYRNGDFGYFVGPNSKGSVDFLYIFQGAAPLSALEINDSKSFNDSTADIVVLSESIIRLKSQVNKLAAENEELRKLMKAMKSERKDNEEDKSNLEETLKELQVSTAKTRQSNDSLLQANNELLRYKKLVEGQGNEDLVISLSRSLKNEKLKNDSLIAEKKQLQESISKLQKKNIH